MTFYFPSDELLGDKENYFSSPLFIIGKIGEHPTLGSQIVLTPHSWNTENQHMNINSAPACKRQPIVCQVALGQSISNF